MENISYEKGKKILYFIFGMRYIWSSLSSLFLQLSVDNDTLVGVVKFGFNGMQGIVPIVIGGIMMYLLFEGNKWVENLFLVMSVLSIILNLMIIQTSNFSLYNIILIISCIIEGLVFWSLRVSKDTESFLKSNRRKIA